MCHNTFVLFGAPRAKQSAIKYQTFTFYWYVEGSFLLYVWLSNRFNYMDICIIYRARREKEEKFPPQTGRIKARTENGVYGKEINKGERK